MSFCAQSPCRTASAEPMGRRRLAWGVWLAAAALLYVFENNTGTRALLAASVLLPAASIISAVRSAGRVSVSLAVPERCKRGENAACALRPEGLLPGAVLAAVVEAENRLTCETAVLSLSAAGRRETAFTLTAACCGTVQLSLREGRVQDIFGLWRSRPISCPAAYLTVLPALFRPEVSLAESAVPSAEGERWSMSRPGFDPSETFSIREYRPGDPVRQIHWKLSQKTDATMLRELGLPVAEEILLLLDTAVRPGFSPAAMSASAEALLSLSRALTSMGIAHAAAWMDRRLDEPELCTVTSPQDYAVMEDCLLGAQAAPEDEDVCAALQKWNGGTLYAHTVVFSPTFPAGVSALSAGNRVTVLLADSTCGGAAASGIHVTAYAPEDVANALSYLEI